METYIYDRHGKRLRYSKNLRGILEHYQRNPADIVIKVKAKDWADAPYTVTFYWPNGDMADTNWADWRVLLDWLKARRSWSIARVTFDAPLYDANYWREEFKQFRAETGNLITRHAYQS